jgi:hypothetical protein
VLLEQRGFWQELLPFAEQLFGRTHPVNDAFRVVKVLNPMGSSLRHRRWIGQMPRRDKTRQLM